VYPFERFSQKAKEALTVGQQEAEKAHDSHIHTQHLLLRPAARPGRTGRQGGGQRGLEICKFRDMIDSRPDLSERAGAATQAVRRRRRKGSASSSGT
jgi:hypothetical protein